MSQTTNILLEEILKTDKIKHLRPHVVPMIGRKATVRDAIESMQKSRRGCVLICHGRDPVGIFTERDVLLKTSAGRPDFLRQPVDSFMTPQPQTISVQDSILKAIRIMTSQGFRHLVVIGEEGEVLGTVSMRNVLIYLAEHFPEAIYNLPPISGQINEERDGA